MEAYLPTPKVVEGLRLLPWVSAAREQMKDDNHYGADEYLDCDACKRRCDSVIRSTFACGWVPEAERSEHPLAPSALPRGLDVTVCAGYTTSLPEVLECGRAMAWRDKGCLPDMYNGQYPTPALRDGIDILSVEQSAAEAYRVRKAREK